MINRSNDLNYLKVNDDLGLINYRKIKHIFDGTPPYLTLLSNLSCALIFGRYNGILINSEHMYLRPRGVLKPLTFAFIKKKNQIAGKAQFIIRHV